MIESNKIARDRRQHKSRIHHTPDIVLAKPILRKQILRKVISRRVNTIWLAILAIVCNLFVSDAERLETKTKAHALEGAAVAIESGSTGLMRNELSSESTEQVTEHAEAHLSAGAAATTHLKSKAQTKAKAQKLTRKFDPSKDDGREIPAEHPFSSFADGGLYEQVVLFFLVIIILCIFAWWYKDYVLDVWFLLTDDGEKHSADHRRSENEYEYSNVPMTDPDHWGGPNRGARNRRPSQDGRYDRMV